MHDLEISGIGYLENIGIRDKDLNISVFKCIGSQPQSDG